jgi:hypothetical protein
MNERQRKPNFALRLYICAPTMAAAMVIYPIFASLDLRRHIVPPDQVRDGDPEKDAIPDVLERRFITAAAATFLDSNDKVIGPPERSISTLR